MSTLLDQVLTPENIDKAWRRLRGDRSRWDCTTRRSDVDSHLLLHMYELTEQVRSGRYVPGSMRQFTIAKSNGKRRLLSALYLRDKLVQRAVLQVIEPIGEHCFDDDSFGYRPGRSVDMAIARSLERIDCGYDWLVDADIRQFFDSIPHKQLLKAMQKVVDDKQLIALMHAWLKQSCVHTPLFSERKGIAQGAVLSPIQCNVYLDILDRYWRKTGIPFVRFADDFLLFTQSRSSAEKALSLTRRKLNELRLEIHPEKTSIVKASRKVSFLGKKLRGARTHCT